MSLADQFTVFDQREFSRVLERLDIDEFAKEALEFRWEWLEKQVLEPEREYSSFKYKPNRYNPY